MSKEKILKIFNKPKKENIDFFGYPVAFIFANPTVIILFQIIILLVVIIFISGLIGDVREVGLKTIVTNIWEGTG